MKEQEIFTSGDLQYKVEVTLTIERFPGSDDGISVDVYVEYREKGKRKWLPIKDLDIYGKYDLRCMGLEEARKEVRRRMLGIPGVQEAIKDCYAAMMKKLFAVNPISHVR